ncbi:hypothetical protein [Streptomyces sp. NPDC001604]|uniref:hypothetical protein n=1 Tax=Streptomyces sp. NPDC001604 TaxID=3364593 RepID=UPI003674CE81
MRATRRRTSESNPGKLTEWLRNKEEALKPTTFARHRDYDRSDLIPAFERLALQDLRPRHLVAWQDAHEVLPRHCPQAWSGKYSSAGLLQERARRRGIATALVLLTLLP